MSKILQPNYTQIPNVIFDYWLQELDHSTSLVLLFLCRKTFGWQKIKDCISLKQIETAINMSRPRVIKSLKILEERNLIIKCVSESASGAQCANTYKMRIHGCEGGAQNSFDGSKQNLPGVVNDIDYGSKQNLPGVVNDIDSQKKDLQKKPLQKKISKEKIIKKEKFDPKQELIELGASQQVAGDLLKLRAAKRAPITKTLINSVKNELLILKNEGISANDAFVMWIEKNWQGFKADWVKNQLEVQSNNSPYSNSFKTKAFSKQAEVNDDPLAKYRDQPLIQSYARQAA